MARKVTCQICKTKGDSDTFYKVTDDKGRSKYYCNKDEYDNFMNEKLKRERLVEFVVLDVFGYEEGQTVNSILFKKLKDLNNFYDNDVIYNCFKEHKDTIQYWIKTKESEGFQEFNTICYVMKIIEGNINDVYKKWKFKKQQELKQERIKLENNSVDLNIINQMDTNTTKKTDDSGILAFLDEEDM
jgi:hypothetical protein